MSVVPTPSNAGITAPADALPATTDVVVIGGGPVGMLLALTLHRAGVDAVVVDDKPGTRTHSQAAVLWPRTLEILDLLGVVDRLRGQTVGLTAATMVVDGHYADLEIEHVDSPHPVPALIGQDRTERVLDDELHRRGRPVIRNARATSVIEEPSGVVVTIRTPLGEHTIQAAYAVGCEGSHSLVRQAAGIARTGERNAGVQLIQGDTRIDSALSMPPGRAFLFSTQQRASLFLLPVDVEGHYRVLLTLPDDGSTADPTLEELEDAARRFLPDLRLTDAVWLSRYRTQQANADTYGRGRLFIAGDAAHVWVPIGGQGMNLGLHDAFDLGWKLAAVVTGQAQPALLDTYTSERRPVADGVIAFTGRAYGAFLDPAGPLDRGIRALLPRALGVRPLTERVVRHLAEIDTRYGPSLVVDDSPDRGAAVRPGERAPDAYVHTGTATRRLFDLFRAPTWTLLGFAAGPHIKEAVRCLRSVAAVNPQLAAYLVDSSPAAEDEAAQGAGTGDGLLAGHLRDIPRLAATAYDIGDDPVVVAVRPDGVIAYRGPLRDEDDVRAVSDVLARVRAGAASRHRTMR